MRTKEQEIWKDIVGYEGLYQISNFGRVKNIIKHRYLKTRIYNGYSFVGLSKNGKQTHYCVHKIIAQSFVDNPDNCKCVRHKDGDRQNNNPNNLEWYNRLVCGVGVLDVSGVFSHGETIQQSYNTWSEMIYRCYDSSNSYHHKYYEDCFVCDEWLYFSNFKKWFDDPENGYKDGYHLDKDIIVTGNRTYCPECCCFVPQEINKAIILKRNKKSKYKKGVGYDKERKKFLGIMPKSKFKRFDTEEEAYQFYKCEKEQYIKELATKYYSKGHITKRVYDSLMKYEVK